MDRHIVVDRITKKKPIDKERNHRTLFIGNLPFDTDEEELRSFFEAGMKVQKSQLEDGKQDEFVESVRLIRSKDQQKGKGFGYVTLKVGVGSAVETSLRWKCRWRCC